MGLEKTQKTKGGGIKAEKINSYQLMERRNWLPLS
jgi:hypothetical protein